MNYETGCYSWRWTPSGRGARRGRSASTTGADVDARKKANQNVEMCGTCEKEIGDDTIGCDECEYWVHDTEMCSGLTQDMLDAIGRYNGHGIKFVCTKCRLTLAHTRCFATFARAGGGGGVGATPPGDRPLMVVELRGKNQSMRLDEISRLHILFLVLG